MLNSYQGYIPFDVPRYGGTDTRHASRTLEVRACGSSSVHQANRDILIVRL